MKKFLSLFFLIAALIFSGCVKTNENNTGKIKAVSTITIISDVVKNIGKDKVDAISICGVGIDPHTYKSKPDDVKEISKSEIVFTNGFTLEHWIEEIIHNSGGNKAVITVTNGVTPLTDETGHGDPDPHAWFNVLNVKVYADNIAKGLSDIDPANKDYYKKNAEEYKAKLDELDSWIKTEIAKIPQDKRVLITSHDAFRYFGKAYGLDVRGLQGISTEAKIRTEDVAKLIDLIKEKKLKSVFIETSVNPKVLEQISSETGATVGGTLFSDSIGNEGTPEGEYIGAVKHNVNAIVNALK